MSWKKVRLGDAVKISKGKKHIETPLSESSKRYIQIEDLTHSTNEKFTDENGIDIKKNDVIIAWDGANAGKVGSNLDGVIGSTLARLRILEKELDHQFLYRFLDSKFEFIKSQRTGATIPHVSGEAFRNLQIPLPPLPTQKHIASILDKADALRQQNRQLLAHYDALLQSTFIEMFGDLSQNSENWNTQKIEDIAETKKGSMRTGPFGSDLLHSEFTDNGVFVLGIDNVVNNRFEWDRLRYISLEKYEKLKRYTVNPGDLLISIMATVGRVAIVPEGMPLAINSKHLAAITLDRSKVEPVFIAYNLHSNPNVVKQITSGGRGAIMTGLNLGLIRKIKLKIPPLILQHKFAEISQEIESQKQQAQASLAESEALFQGLLSGYFGEN